MLDLVIKYMLQDKRKIILVTGLLLLMGGFILGQSEKPSDDSILFPLNISDNEQTKEGSIEVDFLSTSDIVSPEMIVGYSANQYPASLQIFNNNDNPERLILKLNDDAEEDWIMTSLDNQGRAEWMDPKQVIENSGLYIGSNIWKKDEQNRVSLVPNIKKLAIGPNLTVNGDNSVAIGKGIGYTGTGSLAINTQDSINSFANGSYSVLISSSSQIQRSLGDYSAIISSREEQSIASGNYSLVLGSGSVDGDYSVSLLGGEISSNPGSYSSYILGAPESQENYVLAIGSSALTKEESTFSISTGSGECSASGRYSVVIGTNTEEANVTGRAGTAIVNSAGAQLSGYYSSVVGSGSTSLQALYASALLGGDVRSRYSSAIGQGAVARAESSTAINMAETLAQTFGRYSTIFQVGSHSSSVNGIASTIISTGSSNINSGANYSTVIGSGIVQSNRRSSLAMAGGEAGASYSTAIGSFAKTEGAYSLAIKTSAGSLNAKTDYATAIGVSSQASDISGVVSTALLVGEASIEDDVEHSTIIGYGTIGNNDYGTSIWGGRVEAGEGINQYATAIGRASSAKGIASTAIGLVGNIQTANAYGDYSTIISVSDQESVVNASYSTALLIDSGNIGQGADHSTIIGWGDIEENAINAVAMMGGNARAISSLAIGENSVASGLSSVAIGRGSSITASGQSSTIVSNHDNSISEALGNYSVAILNNRGIAWGENSVVIGSGDAIGRYSTVIGGGQATADYGLAIQNDIDVPGSIEEKAISIKGHEASGRNSTAVLFGKATGRNAVAIGAQALASGLHSTSITAGGDSHESRVISSGSYSVAIGDCFDGSSTALGIASVVLTGNICPTTASGNYSTSLSGGIANKIYATAMLESTASGIASVALGQSEASGDRSVALRGGIANSFGSVAMAGGKAMSMYSMAVGYGVENQMANSFLTYGLRVQDGKVTVSEDNSYNNWDTSDLYVIGDMKANRYQTQLVGSPLVTYYGIRAEENKTAYNTGSGQLENGIATIAVPDGMSNPSVYVYSLSEGRDIIASVSGQTITFQESSLGNMPSNPSASFNYIIQEELD